MRIAAGLALLGLLAAAPSAASGPRLVSINPCIDAILVRVADADQIAGISHYSRDPKASSIPPAVADRFHATSGTAEEVVALAPDLVLSGPHVSPSTILALERMRVRIARFDVPATAAESEAQARAIAVLAGHPERGEALARRMAAALEEARSPAGRPVPALIWLGGGLVPGAGTLADELLRRTGFANMSASYGLKQWDVLPLEYLIARPPRVLLSVPAAEAGGDRLAGHPAIARLGERIAVEPFPQRLLQCGGPTIVDAVARLARIRRRIAP